MINNEDNDNFATMLVNGEMAKKDTIQGGTIISKAMAKENKEAPDFIKYFNEMDMSYDSIKLGADLYQKMEKRKKGNDEDLRALNILDDEKNTSSFNQNDHRTMTIDKDSISSETSRSIQKVNPKEVKNYSIKNVYEFEKNNHVSNNNSSNFSEMIEKKSFVDAIHPDEKLAKNYFSNNKLDHNVDDKLIGKPSDNSIISKDNNSSTMKMNLNKPLLLNPHNLLKQVGKIDSKEIIELLEDNALKAMEVDSLEESLKKTYSNMEREIQLVKEKYQDSIKKFSIALEFLKSNPHLKNLKEYEDYSKFSKVMDQSKFSLYSNDEGSIGGSSMLPLNNVKVHKYKDNNINSKNK